MSRGRGVDFKYSTSKTTSPTDATGTIGQSTSTGLELVMVTSNQVAFAPGSKAIRSTLIVTPSSCPEALALTILALAGGIPGPDPSTGLAGKPRAPAPSMPTTANAYRGRTVRRADEFLKTVERPVATQAAPAR